MTAYRCDSCGAPLEKANCGYCGTRHSGLATVRDVYVHDYANAAIVDYSYSSRPLGLYTALALDNFVGVMAIR